MKSIIVVTALSILSLTTLISCSSSTTRYTNQINTFKKGSCSVQIFYSKSTAEDAGPIQEVCTVEGSTAFSFDHSLEGAVKKNLPALCACGVDMAYIATHHTQSDMGLKGVTHVNLVGFKLKN